MNSEYRIRLIIYFVAGAFLFSGGYLLGEQEWVNSDTFLAQDLEAAQSLDMLGVDIKGAVAAPGFYQVKAGTRLAELLKLAKPLVEADLSQINQAEYVEDGQEITVPGKGKPEMEPTEASTFVPSSEPTPPPGVKPSQSGKTSTSSKRATVVTGPININSANAKELETLPGIGPALAQRIIEYRETEGAFQTGQDLCKVKGIGAKRLADLEDKITF